MFDWSIKVVLPLFDRNNAFRILTRCHTRNDLSAQTKLPLDSFSFLLPTYDINFSAPVESFMPPKPNKNVEETLQSILDKLAGLQTQFDAARYHQEGRYTAFQNATDTRQFNLETKHDTLHHAANYYPLLQLNPPFSKNRYDFDHHTPIFLGPQLQLTSTNYHHVSHRLYYNHHNHHPFPSSPSQTIHQPKIQLVFFVCTPLIGSSKLVNFSNFIKYLGSFV